VAVGRLLLARGRHERDELRFALGQDRHGSGDLRDGGRGVPLGASGELLGGGTGQEGLERDGGDGGVDEGEPGMRPPSITWKTGLVICATRPPRSCRRSSLAPWRCFA
jgi:hypothetical protein